MVKGGHIRMTVGMGLGMAVAVAVGINNDVAISTTWSACILAFEECIFRGFRHEEGYALQSQSMPQTGRSPVFMKGICSGLGRESKRTDAMEGSLVTRV